MAYQVKPYLNLPDDYDPVLAELYNNGCGPAGWKGKAVPDTNYGIDISDACHVHDFDFGKEKERGYFRLPKGLHPIVIEHIKENYKHGLRDTFSYFEMYNFRFWTNILLIIDNESKWWNSFLNPLRRRRAKTYFWFTMETGREYFNK